MFTDLRLSQERSDRVRGRNRMTFKHSKRRGKDSQKPVGTGGKIGMTLFGMAFFCAGVLFCWLIITTSLQVIDSYSWSEHVCEVTASEVEKTRDREDPYRLQVKYSYAFKGQSFKGDRIGFSGRRYKSLIKAEQAAGQYPVGQSVVCLVNPDVPAEAILLRDSLWILIAIPLPLIFVLIGGAIVVGAWWPDDGKSSEQNVSSRGVSFKKKSTIWPIAKVFLLLLCLLGGVVGTYYLGVLKIKALYAAERWPSVQGEVIDSRVIESRGDDSTTYRGYVAYRYEVDGVEHRSDQFSFISMSSSCYSCARKIVKDHPKGSTVRVYFNPDQTTKSVLDRNWRWSYLFGFLPAIFALIGGIGLYDSVKKSSLTREAGPLLASNVQIAAWAGSLPRVRRDSRTGLYNLAPAHSSRTKFIVILFFTLFWNGIIAMVAADGSSGFSLNVFALFGTLFLIPFVGIGLGLIALTIYLFFGIWSPSVSVLMPDLTLLPDRNYSCKWHVDGSYRKIRALEIHLKAEEKIYYNSGDDRSSRDRTVFKQSLYKTTQQLNVQRGEFELSIPKGAMHTLDTNDTKYIWSILITADVAGLPDVKEEIDIHVGVAHEHG